MASQLQPIYSRANLIRTAFALRYSWAAWSSSGQLSKLPDTAWRELQLAWESDGIRVLETRWTDEVIQITFSTTPQVAPVLLASRAKGRLQYALRKAGTPATFSRKLSLRTVGAGDREYVEEYIRSQVRAERFVDPAFASFLESLVLDDPSVDLGQPSETASGRYWYNLHLVLVIQDRFRFGDHERLAALKDGSLRIAAHKGHRISTLSVMPDHLHVALRGNLEHSPEEIALGLLNNLAYHMGQNAVWQFGYYAGTFGDYRMNAVRNRK